MLFYLNGGVNLNNISAMLTDLQGFTKEIHLEKEMWQGYVSCKIKVDVKTVKIHSHEVTLERPN